MSAALIQSDGRRSSCSQRMAPLPSWNVSFDYNNLRLENPDLAKPSAAICVFERGADYQMLGVVPDQIFSGTFLVRLFPDPLGFHSGVIESYTLDRASQGA